jgi:hypothetical protein
MTDNEKKAIQLSKDRERLRQRLLSAKSCLTGAVQLHYGPWSFNFQAKRLVSKNRKFALQWQVRKYPDMPVSYENQQTNIGTVTFKEV